MTNELLLQALRQVKYPGYNRDIVSFGLVKNATLEDGVARVTLHLTGGNRQAAEQISADVERALGQVAGVKQAQVEVGFSAASGGPAAGGFSPQRAPGIRRVVAVASGKGGVGKSTVSVNLACALRHLGAAVGLLDCDIYGPSIPLMMGVRGKPTVNEAEKLVPVSGHGVKLMSMGFLIDDDAPVIWRGPMIMKTIQQFISDVDWGQLDYLLVDLPPG